MPEEDTTTEAPLLITTPSRTSVVRIVTLWPEDIWMDEELPAVGTTPPSHVAGSSQNPEAFDVIVCAAAWNGRIRAITPIKRIIKFIHNGFNNTQRSRADDNERTCSVHWSQHT